MQRVDEAEDRHVRIEAESVLSIYEPRPMRREVVRMRLSQLLHEAFPGVVPALPDDPVVSGVSVDSRLCRQGNVFVAVPGTAVDGARFALEAAERGAVAVVAERRLDLPDGVVELIVPDARAAVADLAAAFYGHPARDMTVVGVTGTNGKTSTTLLLRSILEAAGTKVALFGTILYEIGARRIPSPTTTPDPVSLQAFLAEARDVGLSAAVMEVSSHALVQQRTRAIPMAAAVFTNLASEHLDYHRDFEAYRAAKSLLFEGLAPGAVAALNSEDPSSAHIASRTAGRVIRYGRNESASVRAEQVRCGPGGISFLLRLPDGGEARITSPLLGYVNVMNCLAAAAAAYGLGTPLEAIARGLDEAKVVPGRLERVEAGQPFTVLVDYAHTDHALENVLRSIRAFSGERRIITVMGCGGDRDRLKRPRMGRAAADLSEAVIVTSDNPRSEDPMAIIGDILAGLEGRTNFEVIPDRRRAIRAAVRMAAPEDIVLIAGKGHETYQIVGGVVHPFDDRRVVVEEIESGRRAK
ncbi:MAG: UDP-N-acetylmuramoyl-L-alanyl-D-glutamate--2,6-diaminopimelate ligase [Planctomycetes bacterium]|nr:UDP-N-acetylmuramoyl-L-alanyl-D-glutamate--2,6-diaminopimelate ligase [Planctomycetota bacterium]